MAGNLGESSDYLIELTEEDISKLMKSPFDRKVNITKKIADYYSRGGFNDHEMEMAQEIFRTLVKDTEVEVRKALSDAVKDIDSMPHDVVKYLAHDVTEVSLPVLEFSNVLTDADLVEIMATSEDIQKQLSICRREVVSETVSKAAVDIGNSDLLNALLDNDGADISNENFHKIIEDFADEEQVMGSVVQREALPVEIIEKLTSEISKVVYQSLSVKYGHKMDALESLLQESSEAATMKMIGMRSSTHEYFRFKALMQSRKISNEMAPIYALCMGNIGIFEVYLARITATPLLNIRTLIDDSGYMGLKAVYRRAHLDEDLYGVVECLLDVLRNIEEDLSEKGIYISDTMGEILISKLREKAAEKEIDRKKLSYIESLIQSNVTYE